MRFDAANLISQIQAESRSVTNSSGVNYCTQTLRKISHVVCCYSCRSMFFEALKPQVPGLAAGPFFTSSTQYCHMAHRSG